MKKTKLQKLQEKMRRESAPPEARTYGICSDQYIQMHKAQNGKCAICGQILRRPHVDHNHVTKEVRQLLCGACNSGLGHFEESPERMLRAIEYIHRWK